MKKKKRKKKEEWKKNWRSESVAFSKRMASQLSLRNQPAKLQKTCKMRKYKDVSVEYKSMPSWYSGSHLFYAKLWTVADQKPMVKKIWKNMKIHGMVCPPSQNQKEDKNPSGSYHNNFFFLFFVLSLSPPLSLSLSLSLSFSIYFLLIFSSPLFKESLNISQFVLFGNPCKTYNNNNNWAEPQRGLS